MQKYYQNELKFNGVYSRNNLTKMMDGACLINVDEYKLIETYRIVLKVNTNNIEYFDSFGLKISQRNLKINRKQRYNNIAFFAVSIENLKSLKHHTSYKKH